MAGLTRFSVSLDKDLVARFDQKIRDDSYPTRSKAVGDLIRDSLIKSEWLEGKEVAGAIVLVYDHHKRELVSRLTGIQHDFHHLIVSTQHIHLDHNNCLEIVVVRGQPVTIQALTRQLKAVKGVKHSSLAATSLGRGLV